MKASQSSAILFVSLFTLFTLPLLANGQDSFGPSRKPRQDSKYNVITNPEALRDVFIPLAPQAAVDKVLLEVNGQEGAELLGQFYVGDQTYSKISATPNELGAQPAGQIIYVIGDTTLPNSKICSKDRSKVYMVNAGSIVSDLGLAWSLILDKSQVTDQYYPNGASSLGRLFSMKDFMTHMQPYIDIKSFNQNTKEIQERKIDVAILGALSDMARAQIDGDKDAYEFALKVVTSACSNTNILNQQLNKMAQSGQHFKMGEEETSILKDSATPASTGLPKFTPMNEVAQAMQATIGLTREPLTLKAWITQDGKMHVNKKPENAQADSQFWIIDFNEISSDFTKCNKLNYTLLIDPYTTLLTATGFIVESGKYDFEAIARNTQGQIIPFGEIYSDFQSAIKMLEAQSPTPTVALSSQKQVDLLNAFLFFQSVANMKFGLMENNAAKIEKMKAYAKKICDPTTMNEVHQEMTGRVFSSGEKQAPAAGGSVSQN